MTHQVGVQRAGPPRPAFEEPEVESRKAAGDTAEEEGLGEGFLALSDRADVVVGVVGDRSPAPKGRRGVESGGHPQLHALGPYRVVVIIAVEAEEVGPLSQSGHGAQRRALQANHLVAQLGDRIGKVVDGFVGRLHRNDRHRRHAVPVGGAELHHPAVVGPDQFPPYLGIDVEDEQPGTRVQDAVVDAEVIHPLGVEARNGRGGPVQGVLGRPAPVVGLADPLLAALLRRDGPRRRETLVGRRRGIGVGVLGTGGLAYVLDEDGGDLQDVAVAIHDRVVETRPYGRCL